MFQAAARGLGSGRVERRIAFHNLLNLTFGIDHKSCTVSQSPIRDENAVLFGYLAFVIAEYRITCVEFLGPVVQGRNEVRADRENLRIKRIEFADTRLVGSEFLGSATCECGWKK